ncbi:MAG: 50S ribosomal protein L17 [Elusimicrobia bacterium]|nr:50S ribosomal protein L17 [Elusimicrobiota bacterium]
MAKTGAGRKLGRKTGFRFAMLRSLATDLIRYEQIQTTFPKAKECSRMTERLISVAKKGDMNARRTVARDIQDGEVTKKLFDVLATRYSTRVGGFTKVYRLQNRQGDNAQMALIKLIA